MHGCGCGVDMVVVGSYKEESRGPGKVLGTRPA